MKLKAYVSLRFEFSDVWAGTLGTERTGLWVKKPKSHLASWVYITRPDCKLAASGSTMR